MPGLIGLWTQETNHITKTMKNILITTIATGLAVAPLSAGDADAFAPITLPGSTSDWEFSFEAYLLGSAIEGDTSIGLIQNAALDVGFDDILENLDMGAMLHFEAIKNNRWGFYLDYGFMDLSGGTQSSLGGTVKAEVRQGVLEAVVFRRFSPADYTIDIYGGVRWWDNDVDIDVNSVLFPGTTNVSIEKDWIDAIVGARLFKPISENYTLTSQLDLGGFELESNFTASGSVGIQYQVSDSIIVDLRYKATWVDYERGSIGSPGSFAYDTVTHGPLLGVIFKF